MAGGRNLLAGTFREILLDQTFLTINGGKEAARAGSGPMVKTGRATRVYAGSTRVYAG